ncbi:hypothetical protein DYB32_009799, partial [Aphanomyces invadans]
QEREIAGIIEMETKMAEIQKQNAAREAIEAKRKAEWEKEKKDRRAALMAAKHEREILKKKAEDAEAVARRIRAKREAEKEKALLEEMRKEEKQRQLVRPIGREKANQRIQLALEQNQHVMQKKKKDFDAKQALAAARAMEVHKKEMQGTCGSRHGPSIDRTPSWVDLKARAERNKKEEEIRVQRVEAARTHQQARVQTIVEKRSQLESHLDVVYHERVKDRALKSVEREMTLEEKKANVERIKKVEEFNRLQTLIKISQEDSRSRMIKLKKQALIEARKKIALASRCQLTGRCRESAMSPGKDKSRKKKLASSKSASDLDAAAAYL